jgi:nicotinamidase-related amidase
MDRHEAVVHSLDNRDLLAYYQERGWCGRVGFGRQPAVLVVDMAAAWTDPLARVGSDLGYVLDNIVRLLAVARRQSVPVFFTTMAYEPNMADAGAVFHAKLRHLDEFVRGSANVELHPALERRADEVLIVKQRPSAFFGTTLLSQLIARHVDTLIITGCSTSGCIRATAESSINENLHTIVPDGAVGDRSPSAHAANLFDINARYADVLPLDDVLAYLERLPVEAGAAPA